MGLVLAGLGVHGPRGLAVGALEDLRVCGRVLLDSYTSPVDARSTSEELSKMLGRTVEVADRGLLEDVDAIMSMAEGGCLGIVIPGDVFVATTHETLRQEAIRRGLEIRVWHSSSVMNAIMGRLGLHSYKLGFVGTLIRGPPQTAYRAYFGVNRALRGSQHSILLLQQDVSGGEVLGVGEALELLRESERSWRTEAFSDDRIVIVASRVYMAGERLLVAKLSDALSVDHGDPPHAIVVPGRLHYTEKESILSIAEVRGGASTLDAAGQLPLSLLERLAGTAISKTRAALPKFMSTPRASSLLENVESYLTDAEAFLRGGQVEMALAEASYAEGLLDSLRLLGLSDVNW